MNRLLSEDASIVVWWGTRLECASAISRLVRMGTLIGEGVNEARASLNSLADNWLEIQPDVPLRTAAEGLLAQHPLRVADALQLAAALEWCDDDPVGRVFTCLDRRLREAATREGFTVLPIP